MECLKGKLVGIAEALVIGTMIRHSLMYRQEVRKPWGCPSFTKGACDSYTRKGIVEEHQVVARLYGSVSLGRKPVSRILCRHRQWFD